MSLDILSKLQQRTFFVNKAFAILKHHWTYHKAGTYFMSLQLYEMVHVTGI